MKIVSVSMAKNEEYVLESFVRHSLTFSDQVIVYDHNSTDGTKKILDALKNEFQDRIVRWHEQEKTVMIVNQEVFTRMIRHAFDILGADMVMPLDTDEFPVLENGKNLRNYLECLDPGYCYRAHFMPFTVTDEWKEHVFYPLLFKHRKKLNNNTDSKMILMKDPYYDYGIEMSLGNHQVLPSKNTLETIPVHDLYPNLFYAHYPFRNRDHLENKLVLRQLALSMRYDIDENNGFQYAKGFRQISEGYSLSEEDMAWYCLNNMCGGQENLETMEEIQNSIEEIDPSTLFPGIELKYSGYMMKKSNYRLLMEFTYQVTTQYASEKKAFEELKKEYHAVCDNLKEIRGSKAWKFIQTYRKIVGKHDKTQD